MESARQNAKGILLVILGATILAFGNYNLNYQNDLTEGGVLGLMLLLKHLFDISPSLTSLVVDTSLAVVGAKFFGKKFFFYSVLSTVTFSLTYRVWSAVGFVIPNLTGHMIIASILAGIVVGLGVGLVVKGGGAAGGDDVIAILGSKFSRLKINHMYYIMDAVVLLLSLTYLSPDKLIYSVFAILVSGKLISIIYNVGNKEVKVKEKSKEKLKTQQVLV